MRVESSTTSVSWIPSETVPGLYKTGFAVGASHSDDPPPEVLDDPDGLFAAGRFRFANRLAAWIEVEGGQVVDAGYAGRGYISTTRFGWGPHREVTFQPAEFPEIRTTPEITPTGARFSQTTGGRTGAPMPRPVSSKPYFEWLAPTGASTGLTAPYMLKHAPAPLRPLFPLLIGRRWKKYAATLRTGA